jgi:hypothetical protein
MRVVVVKDDFGFGWLVSRCRLEWSCQNWWQCGLELRASCRRCHVTGRRGFEQVRRVLNFEFHRTSTFQRFWFHNIRTNLLDSTATLTFLAGKSDSESVSKSSSISRSPDDYFWSTGLNGTTFNQQRPNNGYLRARVSKRNQLTGDFEPHTRVLQLINLWILHSTSCENADLRKVDASKTHSNWLNWRPRNKFSAINWKNLTLAQRRRQLGRTGEKLKS